MVTWATMSKRKDSELLGPAKSGNTRFGHIRVEKYRGTRHWGVWVNDELLAVTVYKKGALAIRETLCPESQGFNFDSSKTESTK